MHLYLTFWAFVVGTIFASFIKCVAYRIPNKISIMTRSRCDSCGRTLQPLDLIPILSWVFLKGKCRYCGAKIPISCVISEAVLGIYFAIIMYIFYLSITTLILLVVGCIVLYIVSMID